MASSSYTSMGNGTSCINNRNLVTGSRDCRFLEAAQYLSGMANSFEPDCPQIPEEEYPEVDVLIPTYNEPYEVLIKTINGAINMDYP